MKTRLFNIIPFLLLLFAAFGCGPGELEPSQARQALGRDPLPNWATPAEKEIDRLAGSPPARRGRIPPPAGYRVPAEYEPTAAVVMTWAGYSYMLSGIAEAAAEAGAEVWMVGGPSSLSGVPSEQYRRLNLAYDSVWARDYGPVGIDEQTGELGIIDTTYRHWAYRENDDALPCRIAQEAEAACYATDLILDGGNYMSDGKGTVFITERVYEWNSGLSETQVNTLLADYLGAETIQVFDYARDSWGEPADGTGHIDMFAKLIADCKVLVAETTESPFRQVLDAAAATFAGLECAPGQNYQVYRVPGWTDWGVWYTYTNALMVNDTIILPGYADGDDAAARQIVQGALPNHRVVTVNSDNSITAGGSIHCVTRELPAVAASGCASPADCDLLHVGTHTCTDGLCGIATCEDGWANCDELAESGCETPLGTDADCGACGDVCALNHAQASCQAGACGISACDAGWGDCDTSAANGCETPLGTDANCAACGDVCSFDHAQAACQAGACALVSCDGIWSNCDGVIGNGCEADLSKEEHCGACEVTCQASESCLLTRADYACTDTSPCEDADGDGAADATCGGTDCDDGDRSVHPGADETCNGRDDDCDGLTDEDLDCDPTREEPKVDEGCGCAHSHSHSGDGPLLGLWGLFALASLRRRW